MKQGKAVMRLGLAALILVLLQGSNVAGSDHDEKGQEPEYRVQPGDTVRVGIAGRQDLSGEYVIDLSGRVSVLPMAEVNAAGLTARELGRRIADVLRETSGEPAAVSVQLASYRPVYVLGNVQTPGAYPFVPGMSALQAVAVAGGFLRASARAADIGSGSPADEWASLRAQQFVLSVRRERLIAEKEGSNDLTLSGTLQQRVSENVLFRAIVESEGRLLQQRLESFELKVQGYRRSQELFDAEVQSLEHQIEVQTRLLSLVEQQLDAVKGIRDKGLVQQSIYLGLERDVSRSKSDLQSTQTYLLRARQDSQAASQSAEELRSVREQGIEEELAANAQELIVLDGRIRGVASVLGVITQLSSLGNDVEPEPRYAIEVLRTGAGGNEVVLSATESTKVRPGDVINIKPVGRLAPEGEVK